MMPSLQSIAAALGGEVIANQYVKAPGPGHSTDDRSLSVTPDSAAPDGFLVHSFAGDNELACKDYVRKKLGLPEFAAKKKKSSSKSFSPTVERYTYRLADGAPYLQVHRTAAKDFPQYHWDGEKWISGAPNGPKVPYLLPGLLKAPPTMPVYIAEGEKDVDALTKLGFAATCNSEGADNGKGRKWTPELNEYFKDRHVYILPDNDSAGRTHAQHVARNLDKIAASIRVVVLPDLKPKGDVSDWLKDDPTGAKLVKICKAAPIWEPTAECSDISEKDFINELAAMTLLEYAKRRKDAAEQIGITATELDKIVAQARDALGSDDDDDKGRGRAVAISDPLPWTEAVTGDMIASSLRAAIKTYAVLPDVAADAITLWILHTWLIEDFTISPRLALTSPTKGCGKTTVLRLIGRVARRAKRTGSISPAALFRAITLWQPTLLMDENEKFMENGGDLHALLNEGHLAGATVLRVLGEKMELREFDIFSAVAFCRNGRMPDDLEQRSIIIRMERRRSNEPLTLLPEGQPNVHLENLKRMCSRWASDNAAAVRGCTPDMGDQINRVADNWRPLFQIADVIGEGWPARAREAAAALMSSESDSTASLLLADIKAIYDERNADRLWSTSICDALAALEGRPWAEWRANKAADPGPLTKNQLARLLKPFGVAPDLIRIGDDVARGYHRHQFEKAFERYLPVEGVEQPLRRHKVDEMATSATFRNVTPKIDVTVPKCEKSNNDGLCDGVTVEKPLGGYKEGNGGDQPPGLSSRAIRQIADQLQDWAYEHRDPNTGNVDLNQIKVEGRRRLLAGGVLPEWLEVETKRVIDAMFGTATEGRQ